MRPRDPDHANRLAKADVRWTSVPAGQRVTHIKRVVAAALAAVSLFLALGGSVRASGVVTLRQYAEDIHQIRLTLDREVAAPDARALELIRRRLKGLRVVRLPEGVTLRTGAPLLASEIVTGDRESVRAAARALDRLDEDLSQPGGVRAPAGERPALTAVYRDDRFHPHPTLLERLLDWIAEQLGKVGRLLHLSGPQLPAPGPVADFLIGGGFLVVVAVATYVLARASVQRTTVEATIEGADADPVTAREADLRAESRAAEGDFRSALRFLFLRVMLELQRRGILALHAGLTNREYLRLLREGAPEAGPLRQLIDEFDRVWYGHGEMDREGYERCRELARLAVASTGNRRIA